MGAMTFLKPQLMKWGPDKITDHNRSDLSVDVERIETSHRMANGTRRSYIIADKRTFSCSWDDLPHSAEFTVDGFWGGREIENFYNAQTQPFDLVLTNGDGTTNTYKVVMTEFSKSIKKRGRYDFWDVDITLEEV